jgi:molybdopterin-synthase adenylyltransferase
MPSDRYARQAALAVIGPAGQQRLSTSTVLVVGCGALGSTQAELCARAGVGSLVLVDRDIVELSNLHRQSLFCERDVRDRLPKAAAAERRLRDINSEIRVEGIVADLTAANVVELIRRVDLVLDGTDNFETRYLLNDAAVREGKPWIYGGVLATEGMVLPVDPGSGPCLRCVFPEPPAGHGAPTCETLGVLNATVAWVAALQVVEALRRLTGATPVPAELRALDVWRGWISSVKAPRDEDCPCCGQRRFEFLEEGRGSSSTVLCGRNAVQITPEKPGAPDLRKLAAALAAVGPVTMNGLVLDFEVAGRRLVVFPDGRVLVMGTTDTAEARTLVAKYVGS